MMNCMRGGKWKTTWSTLTFCYEITWVGKLTPAITFGYVNNFRYFFWERQKHTTFSVLYLTSHDINAIVNAPYRPFKWGITYYLVLKTESFRCQTFIRVGFQEIRLLQTEDFLGLQITSLVVVDFDINVKQPSSVLRWNSIKN